MSVETKGRGLFRFRHVRTKLLSAFLAVAAVMTFIGVFGLTQQSSIAASTDKLYKDVTVPIQDLAVTRGNMLKARGAMLDAALTADPAKRQELFGQVEGFWADVDGAQKRYQATDMTGREKARDAFNAAWPEYKELIETKGLPALKAGDFAGFTALRETELMPAFKKAMGAVDELFKIENKAGETLKDEAQATASRARTLTLVLLVIGVALAVGLGFVIARGVANPLGASVDSLEALAHKDLTRQLDVSTSDETAKMAEALNTAVANLSASLGQINSSSETLAAASEELMAVSTQMGSNAEETSAQSNVVAAAGEQVSRSVTTVATAVEEMTASIREIAKNASDAARVAANAVEEAQSTNAKIAKLDESSVEIGNVVKVITSIAEQTNLLALNATIEAARAGESGKGFAVVANEVKDLANETARATEDISRKIETIQGDTTEAVTSIGRITEIISQINDIQNTIASAVEEQAATTNEIGRNVAEAARGSQEISENISGVAQAAQSTADGVGSTQQAAEDLSRMASELKGLVGEFSY